MNPFLKLFIVLLIPFVHVQLKAQAPSLPCLTDTLMQREFVDLPRLIGELDRSVASQALSRGGTEPIVSVVVHVVYNTPAENIPESVIQAFVAQMDEDFNLMNANASTVRSQFASVVADVGIRFCLAQFDPEGEPTNGITRTSTTETWFDPNNEPHKMKAPPYGINAWDPTRYLNIWVCDIVGSSGSIVSGYTYLPVGGMAGSWQDGLVIDHYYGVDPSDRTPTHEAGHYFGLRHTFDGNSCSLDDGFSDTPNTNSPTWNCSNTGLVKCGQLTQYENYMDYSGCTAMFTMEQAAYMNGVLNGVRVSLLGSAACSGPIALVEDQPRATYRVFPNPTRDEVRILSGRSGMRELLVVDARGRSIKQVTLSGPDERLDVRGMAPGPYQLVIWDRDGARETHPLIVIP